MSTQEQIKTYWDQAYRSTDTPFDIDRPDDWIAGLEKNGEIRGNVLDAGCGPGRTAIHLARRGYLVLGVDLSTQAVERAREKALSCGIDVQFQQADICRFPGYESCFDTVIDIGCFHSLCTDDRIPYARNLHRICRPDARIFLRAFSSRNKPEIHPTAGLPIPAITEEQIRGAFSSQGWNILELAEKEIELFVSDSHKPRKFCWFAKIQRA